MQIPLANYILPAAIQRGGELSVSHRMARRPELMFHTWPKAVGLLFKHLEILKLEFEMLLMM
jgi:hypothetical protein